MKPNLIKSTANSALELMTYHGRGSTEAFLLSWVAWEGLKIRLAVVGLHMQGWKVADIYDGLSAARVHSNENYLRLFRTIYGSNPQNTKGIGSQWKTIEEFRTIRNRYAHGTGGAAPMKLEAGTHLITDSVLDTDWLSRVPITTENGRVSLGDPYRRLVTTRSRHRSHTSLKALLKEVAQR